jgi:hypothetical protein
MVRATTEHKLGALASALACGVTADGFAAAREPLAAAAFASDPGKRRPHLSAGCIVH